MNNKPKQQGGYPTNDEFGNREGVHRALTDCCKRNRDITKIQLERKSKIV